MHPRIIPASGINAVNNGLWKTITSRDAKYLSFDKERKKERKKEKVRWKKRLQLSRLSITLSRWQNVIYDLDANDFYAQISSRARFSLSRERENRSSMAAIQPSSGATLTFTIEPLLRGWHLEPRSRKIARRQGRYTVAIRRSSPCSYWEGFLLVAPGEMHVGCINGRRPKCLIVSWREPC